MHQTIKKVLETMPANNQKYLRKLLLSNLFDDSYMGVFFDKQRELFEFVCRIILNKPDLKIVSFWVQYKMCPGMDRVVCFDLYGIDSEGKLYNVEIQKDPRGATPFRARYYSAAIDVHDLDRGKYYDKLPETFVIFITKTDFFEKGKPIYRFDRYDKDSDCFLGDAAHIIYVNGQYRGDDDLGRLMYDFDCIEPSEMNSSPMKERAIYLKETLGGFVEMSSLLDQVRAEGLEEGLVKGEKKGLVKGEKKGLVKGEKRGALKKAKKVVLNLLPLGLSLEKIAEITGLPIKEVKKMQAQCTV